MAKSTKSQTFHTIKYIIILVLAAGIILAVYLRMTNHSRNSDMVAEENLTETEILKMYDFKNQYPKNARDVAKLHCRLLKCIYNENLSQDEYKQLSSQTRELFSKQLLDENPVNKQLTTMKAEVDDFRSAGKIYISYTVDSENNVKYSNMDGVEYAIVYVTCNIKESTVTDAIEEEYLLCKEGGQWKIVGWQGFETESNIDVDEEKEE